MYIIKKIVIFVLIIIIIGIVILSLNQKKDQEVIPVDNTIIIDTKNENIEAEDEKLFVEKYIRENIKTVAIDEPVLGGSWYVVSININPQTNTGEVVYEDGHIQSEANFTYLYQKTPQDIAVTKWEIKE
jgi:hypothetical protein